MLRICYGVQIFLPIMLNILLMKDLCLKSDCSIRVYLNTATTINGECSIRVYHNLFNIFSQTLPITLALFLTMYYAQNYAGIVGWSLARIFSILLYRFVFLVSLFLYNTETSIPISLFMLNIVCLLFMVA